MGFIDVHTLTVMAVEKLGTAEELGLPNKATVGSGELKQIMNVIYMIAVVVAVIVIIIAGILYATSSGDPGKTTKAKNAILYAIIGLVVVIVAYTVTTIVMNTAR